MTSSLPIEAIHTLKERLLANKKNNEASSSVVANDNNNNNETRAHACDRLLAQMDASLIAQSIIKDSAANQRLHALAIARRLRYCLDA